MVDIGRRFIDLTSSVSSSALQRRHRPDYQIILFVGLLMLLGLIIMYAIGPQRANVLNSVHNTTFYTDTYFVIKQTVSLLLAVTSFVLMTIVPFSLLKKYSTKILWVGLGLCALLFIAGNLLGIDSIATNTLGAYRWFNLGPLGSFQPAELLKFGVLIYMAVFLGIRSGQGMLNDFNRTIVPIVTLSLVCLFIVVVVQKDLGTGLALGSIILSIIIVSGIKSSIVAKILVGVAVLGILAIMIAPHRLERVATFFQGDKSSESSVQEDDANYHIKNAMIALGTGGFIGLGIGNSVQATGYLPEAINDSVFAIIGETFGFIGVVVILALFSALLVRLLKIADSMPDMTMRLATAGVWGWLTAHVVLNIASMTGIFPLTGITLPLLSFGGTSMMFIAAALGMVFQLSRYTAHQPVQLKEIGNENTRSRRRVGGSRYTGRRGNK